MISLPVLTEALLIVTALSMDAFVSGFAYGADKIKIPFVSVTVINLICCAILAVSLFLGGMVGPYLPKHLTTAICFALLMGLGLSKVFDSAVKSLIRRCNPFKKKIRFSAFHLGFVLNIYADPQQADRDHSNTLSPGEAAYLALALSLDGLAVGFGAGMTDTSALLVVALSLLSNMAGVMLGCWLGDRITRRLRWDLTWLSGVLLVVLAVMKLL